MTPKQPMPITELSADAYRKCIMRIDVGMTDTQGMTPEEEMQQAIRYAVASARCLEARLVLERALDDLSFN